MNYRHVYHAGNFANVVKHITLILCREMRRMQGEVVESIWKRPEEKAEDVGSRLGMAIAHHSYPHYDVAALSRNRDCKPNESTEPRQGNEFG